MADFLLELRSEEIPARMQDKARDDLARLFSAELEKAGLTEIKTITYATPRRLVLIANGLQDITASVIEELKGPPADAPDAAIDGFVRKIGLTRNALQTRDVKGRPTLFAVISRQGRRTADVLAEAIPAIVRQFPWPKSMRWGEASESTESLRWVRPLHGIVALLGSDVVNCEVAGIRSGRTTNGHRFQNAGDIELLTADKFHYLTMLTGANVMVDQDARKRIIRERAAALAVEAGLDLIEDEGLVAENAGLTEWPVPLLGRFDADFLQVPPEVIQLTARVNQKYFVCRDAAGKLANAFICTANIDAADGGAKIVEGNRKVLAARLSDARFFYETDLKVPLEEQAKKLEKIVFHEKLGTVADKVERVAKLARWLVEEGIVTNEPLPFRGGDGVGDVSPRPSFATRPHPNPSPEGEGLKELADQAERAARLCKADLVTGMVGEFPELQGLMGGYYAAAQGEDAAVAEAVRDHYKPVGQGDDVPTAPVAVAVSLADKLDSLAMFFAVGILPTGSRDPFALRRAAIGSIELITKNALRLDLRLAVDIPPSLAVVHATFFEKGRWNEAGDIEFSTDTLGIYSSRWDLMEGFVQLTNRPETAIKFEHVPAGLMPEMVKREFTSDALLDFFADRLKVQQREAGVRHDLIDAVFALGGEDDLVRLLARVRALQSFVGTEDGANLLAGYKRAANILKKEGWATETPLPAREGLGVGAERSEAPAAAVERDPAGRAPTPDPSLAGRGEKQLSYTPERAETALIAALDAAEPAAADAVGDEDFEAAMAALATLRVPIDVFFDSVTVNDPDPAKRAARLALLARVRDAVHTVADFSKIEG